LGVTLLDQVSKMLMMQMLLPGERIVLVPGVFQLSRVHNTGAAFSMLNQHPLLLTALSAILLCIVCVSVIRYRQTMHLLQIGGAILVMGGAFGNLLDRVIYGAVTDFLDIVWIHYPVFNLADVGIVVGVGLWIIQMFSERGCSTRLPL
jgi:signal peptidase II